MFTDDIKNALAVLKAGGLILYPADTGWGVGCDATSSKVVQRLFELVECRLPQIAVLTDLPARIAGYVGTMPDLAWDLIELSEKPLTVIYSGAKNLAPELIAPNGSIAIRVTGEAFSKTLCSRFGKPVVLASANRNGETVPSVFSEISVSVRKGVDYTVAYHQNETFKQLSSGIIKLGIKGEIEIIKE